MNAQDPSFESFLYALDDQISQAESGEPDIIKRLVTCIQLCSEALMHLRRWVAENTFPDQATEIHFFKNVKSQVQAKKIYYQKVYDLHASPMSITDVLMKRELEQKVEECTKCLLHNKEYYEYLLADSKYWDEKYFLRERHNAIFCRCHNCDPDFCTNADCVMAEVIACKQLIVYFCTLISNPSVHSSAPTTGKDPSLPCKLSPTCLVELGYALYSAGAFGNATLKEVMQKLSDSFQIDLVDFYDTFRRIRERKKSPAKFLDDLKTSLIKYMEQADNDKYN